MAKVDWKILRREIANISHRDYVVLASGVFLGIIGSYWALFLVGGLGTIAYAVGRKIIE
jgi:hypothetical protein